MSLTPGSRCGAYEIVVRNDGSFDAAINNRVLLNSVNGYKPAAIVNDAASSPNLIVGNRCRTSVPAGLCGS
jgi:hypothetical protein